MPKATQLISDRVRTEIQAFPALNSIGSPLLYFLAVVEIEGNTSFLQTLNAPFICWFPAVQDELYFNRCPSPCLIHHSRKTIHFIKKVHSHEKLVWVPVDNDWPANFSNQVLWPVRQHTGIWSPRARPASQESALGSCLSNISPTFMLDERLRLDTTVPAVPTDLSVMKAHLPPQSKGADLQESK